MHFYRNYRMDCLRNRSSMAMFLMEAIKHTFTVVLIASNFLVANSICAKASNSTITKEQLIQIYEKSAFAIKPDKLIKVENSKPSNINIVCLAETCIDYLPPLKKYLFANWLQPRLLSKFDPEVTLAIIVYDSAKYARTKIGPEGDVPILANEKIFRDGQGECFSGSVISGGYNVKRITIFVRSSLSEKKFVSCVLLQLMRGSGMVFNPGYEQLWKPGGDLEVLDDSTLATNFRAMARLLEIHFLPITRPGMTPVEFENAVEPLTIETMTGEGN